MGRQKRYFFATHTRGAATAIDTITRTGFPGLASSADSVPSLLSYGDTVAQRSVEERRDPVRVGRLMRVLAELEASTPADERIWTAAGINRVTWVRYEAMLERTHVVQPTTPWQTNRLRRLTDHTKRYFVDTALALALAGISGAQLQRDPSLAGRYLDSFVAAQLRPDVDAARGSLHHLRTRGGEREIDIVVDLGGRLVLIEIKAGVTPTPDDARHLAWARSALGDTVAAAIVLHRGSAQFELVPGTWAVPISSMWDSGD